MKFKAWADLARSLDEDLPPRQTITITDLIAAARAADWDFTKWCYASGYDTSDPEAPACLNACWLTLSARAAPA
jgi:hypothetical protein